AAAGDEQAAHARFAEALEIQEPRGDFEGAGMALSGLASLAAHRGEAAEALELYGRALAAFEEIGDRGEEARILSEMAWTYRESGTVSGRPRPRQRARTPADDRGGPRPGQAGSHGRGVGAATTMPPLCR